LFLEAKAAGVWS